MTPSEYDPLFARDDGDEESGGDGFSAVRRAFEAASRPYLSSPWVWVAWGLVLPAAALATEPVGRRYGASGVLLLWSFSILAGGLFELVGLRRRGALARSTGLARWALRVQGNLSLVGVALSALLLWADFPVAIAGLWLLLLGHSFFALGGLSSPPMRTAGLIFQVGGAAALWPSVPALPAFAVTTAAGCLWLAGSLWLRRRGGPSR